jgi:transcriptional regulator of acetoin/glycerol metabolism
MTLKDGEIHETERLNDKNNRWYLIISMPIKDEHGQRGADPGEQHRHHRAQRNWLPAIRPCRNWNALKTRLEDENLQLKEELLLNKDFEEIVGQSNAILYVLERVKQVAETDATVLIQGETGVGKELISPAPSTGPASVRPNRISRSTARPWPPA